MITSDSYTVRAKLGVEISFKDELFHKRHYPPGSRILEVGCSTGTFLPLGNRIGLDPDARAISLAKWKGRAYIGRIEDADKLFTCKFHAIEMRQVIEHLPDPKIALEVCLRLLFPAGKLVIETPNIRVVRWDFWKQYDHVSPFTLESLTDLVLDAGFGEVEVGYGYYGLWGAKWFLSHRAALKIQDLLYRLGIRDRKTILLTAWRAYPRDEEGPYDG